jgi:ComF family protein
VLLPPIQHGCERCRLPLIDKKKLCAQCLSNNPSFNQVLCHYLFEEPLRALIHTFKYQENLSLMPLMRKLMLDAKPAEYRPDCLIPVPMHQRKLRLRGFNQAALLTKCLSKDLDVPYELSLCRKTTDTEPQASLSLKRRQENLKRAFVSKANGYKHVTIIDDLVTTGSTVNALALSLKEAGVERVDVWCIARTAIK